MIFNTHLVLNSREVAFDMEVDIANPREEAMAYFLQNGKVPEPELVALLMRALRPGDVALDGGANLGYFTMLMSRLVGESGKVFAVEPSPYSLERLRHNLKINDMTNVVVVPKALWSEPGKILDFHLTPDGGYDSLSTPYRTTETIQVETTTLDEIIRAYFPRLIKLDIEGAEIEVLEAQSFLIPSFVVVEASDRMAEAIREKMSFSSYRAYILHESGALPSRVPRQCKLLPKADNSLLLFSWDEAIKEAWPEVVY